MQMREKVGKSRNTVFFQWFGAPEGRKVGSLKRRVRSQLARWEMKNCTPLWREAHFKSKCTKHTRSDHFWKLRCRKSARRCGAKHISKSKCTKHTSVGPLLEVAMSKKCTPLWREAHFEVENVQSTHQGFGPLLEVQMSKKCTPLWREAHFEVKMYKTHRGSDHFWRFRCRFAWQAQGIVHLVKSEQNVRVLYNIFNYNTTFTLHYTTLHYTTLHYTTHYTTLHYITLHYTPLHYTTYTTLPSTTLHLHFTLHYTPLHYTLQLH